MIILGIADSITSGAAVVIDGRVVAAVNEERLNRCKMCMGFPRRSIAEVMRIAGVEAGDIDQVAVATEHLFWQPDCIPIKDYFREPKGTAREMFLSLGGAFSTVAGNFRLARQAYYEAKRRLTRSRQRKMRDVLRDTFGIEAPVTFHDHHLCHAASAYFTSGFEEATVITQDGAGDGKCSRVYRVRRGTFEHLKDLDSYDSVGNYYAYVTHLCGFKAHRHEGKITGLAAYGEPEYLDLLRRFVAWDGEAIRNTGKCFDHSAIRKLERALPRGFSHENLSASVQVLLEEAVTRYCDYWVRQSGVKQVALAGGVFANVKLNQRVHELPSVEKVFVHPGMGDDGLAVGAALYQHSRVQGYRPEPVLRDVYLGPDFTEKDVGRAMRSAGVRPIPLQDTLERTVARLLAGGKVVARFDGRMEYGPRALGNRTIMYQTTDPTVNDWLNKRLSRTEFMPFAPVTLWEDRALCYEDLEGAEETARFMTITFDCTEAMKRCSPAVVHVDGTARPQLIREEDNPSYYAILKEYKALTGIPSLINTSFNMHEEPIVCTPEEAIQAFMQSKLDALVLGSHLMLAGGEAP
ncbi:hypothetical protein GQ464_004415 [Rhodocaloribacter litoris]|uniref:carbamoyltransferase family protein n=1 Tax=Rhodocaloribacter litoris TaxID=2558931 RepID=UPI00142131EF|nr:carbamoyltransferase C-terminal domain-containing protein [Rhodocaloribacter litoris]QXD16204.1 hypothetical protein GQ464_004415 [Rhodocaloribacter litoris]